MFRQTRFAWLLSAALGSVAVAGSIYALTGTGEGPKAGGGPPESLPAVSVPPAESSGWRISVSGAFFSSGATLIELLVQEIAPLADDTIEVRIAADAFGTSALRPADGRPGVSIAPNRPTIVRLTPTGHVNHTRLHVSAIDVVRGSGAVDRVSGEWFFQIPTPPDLGRLLQTSRFSGGESASLAGITVRPVEAVTTSLETLVTVERFGPDNLGDLVAPVLISNGETLYGARVSSATGGRLVTFAFPPVAGDSFEVVFDSFIVDGSPSPASSIDFELAAAMQRQGIAGIPGESGVLSPGDIVVAPVRHPKSWDSPSPGSTRSSHPSSHLPSPVFTTAWMLPPSCFPTVRC